jgi:2,3-bisphosphoglycerate-dependent phosphoglycerate mutase
VDATRIVLVRHGQSRAQADRFVGGHAGCTGLSDLGVRQVTALRDRWKDSGEVAGATALYASILPRAVQTAEILAPALGDLEVRQDCAFCESHAGEGDGLSWEEFDRRWPVPETWTADTRRDPGSETFGEMRDRLAVRLDALVEQHEGETVVVACHGGVVLHSMFRWLDIDPMAKRTRAWLDPVNSSVTEWRRADHPFWGSGVELVRFNDFGHLSGDLLPRRLRVDGS